MYFHWGILWVGDAGRKGRDEEFGLSDTFSNAQLTMAC